MTEPLITISGRQLTEAQAMAVRVAITAYHQEMADPVALGDDEDGRRMTEAYRDRLTEVLQIIVSKVEGDLAAQGRASQSGMLLEVVSQRATRILQLAGIVPEQASEGHRALAEKFAISGDPVDQSAMRLRRMIDKGG